jgi:hypothetical protein
LQEENWVAFQLDRLATQKKKYGRVPAGIDEEALAAVGFAAQILSIMDEVPTAANGLRRRIHGALKNPDDMRGLRLELTAASHFTRMGKVVRFPEFSGEETFDLLVEGFGARPLEVECKSMSGDKGLKIHYGEALEFFSLIRSHSKIDKLTSGRAVTISIPDRLPSEHHERNRAAKDSAAYISAGESGVMANGWKTEISEFNSSVFAAANSSTTPPLRHVLDASTGTRNRHGVLWRTKAGGMLSLVIRSEQSDSAVDTLFATLSRAARKQLSRKRPALLISGLSIPPDAIESIAGLTPGQTGFQTAINEAAHNFLSSEERNHVIGLAFLSQTKISKKDGGGFKSEGMAFNLLRPNSPYWTSDFERLFV